MTWQRNVPAAPSGLGQTKNPGRHNISLSCAAGVAYLEIKLHLLEMEVPWDVSDSAVVEWVCAKAQDPDLSPWVWRPTTKDQRKRQAALIKNKEANRVQNRIAATLLNRKEKTHERLEHLRAWPGITSKRKSDAAKRRHAVRRRDGGLPDPHPEG